MVADPSSEERSERADVIGPPGGDDALALRSASVTGPPLPLLDDEDLQAARRDGVAPATLRAYQRALGEFGRFCQVAGEPPCPAAPATVARYVLALARTRRYTPAQLKEARPGEPAGRLPSRSLIEQHVAAIRWLHSLADEPSPTTTAQVRTVLRGIWRARAGHAEFDAQPKQAATPEIVRALLTAAGQQANPTLAVRDRALLLLLFSHGFRRSEVASLLFPRHVQLDADPPTVRVVRSKTDQEGAGRTLPLLSPVVVDSLRAWLGLRSGRPGPLFLPVDRSGACVWVEREDAPGATKALSTGGIGRVIDRLCAGAGLDPAKFGAHSLRRGFITWAYRKGVPEPQIQAAVGHRMADTTRGYRQEGTLGDREEWAAHVTATEALEDLG